MIVTVRFPVRNDVHIHEPFPIKVGQRTYFMHVDARKKISEVGVRFAAVPPDAAPHIRQVNRGKVKAEINDGRAGEYILLAERDLRAWQSLLAPIAAVRLDFDGPQIKFEMESGEREGPGQLRDFSTTMPERQHRGLEMFAFAGQAFLAVERGVPLIEVMAFFIKAHGELIAGRYID